MSHDAYGTFTGFTERELKITELTAKLTIKQEQANQLRAAIEALTIEKLDDETALKVALKIEKANIGP